MKIPSGSTNLKLSPATSVFHSCPSPCASTARHQIAAHDRDELKLKQAREFLDEGDTARASQNLGELIDAERGNFFFCHEALYPKPPGQ